MRDLRQGRGGAHISRRQNVRLSVGGVPVMDMVDGSGRGVVSCPVPVAGGSSESFAYFPPGDGTDAVVVSSEGAVSQALPVSSASWPPRLDKDANFQNDAPEVADTDDYPDVATVKDVVVKHAGVRIQITEAGELIFSGDSDMRIQMLQGSHLRVSLQDTDASERLPLAGPTVDVINALTDKVSELGSRLASVEFALNQLLAKMAAAAPVAGLVADSIETMATIAVPYVSPSPAVLEDVSSAAFVVSSQTVSEASIWSE